MVALHEIAHCRAGDKGDDAIIMIAPYESAHYPALAAAVTESVLRDHFGAHAPRQVTRIELPTLQALVVVIRHRLDGGVTRSTGPDPHGKTLSGHLLDLRVAWSAAEKPAW